MIDFTKKFLSALSDAEVDHFYRVAGDEHRKRIASRVRNDRNLHFNDREKDLYHKLGGVQAMNEYRVRTGMGVLEAGAARDFFLDSERD